MDNKDLKVFGWSIIVALGGFLFGLIRVLSNPYKDCSTSPLFGMVLQFLQHYLGRSLAPWWQVGPADKYGRKPVLLIIAILYTCSAIESDYSTISTSRMLLIE